MLKSLYRSSEEVMLSLPNVSCDEYLGKSSEMIDSSSEAVLHSICDQTTQPVMVKTERTIKDSLQFCKMTDMVVQTIRVTFKRRNLGHAVFIGSKVP
jgi:hypothetical protein